MDVLKHGAALLLAAMACIKCPLTNAHDFWLQPDEFWAGSNSIIPLTLQVGHGPLRQRSPIPARRITRFQAISPNSSVIDLRERFRLGSAHEDGDLQFAEPGRYILVFQTDNQAQTHLPSIRFNDYLEAEGLTPALQERARSKHMETDGSERYSRCAKSVLQIGPLGTRSQDHVTKPVGLPLEIVPETDPYSLPASSILPVRVIYEGRPLAGALVKMTDLKNDASPYEVHVTDRAGRASFSMPHTGTWLLNVIWTRALPHTEEVDFETTFSSLSLGFP
jgi:uncharacterized GH25 family protein